MNETDKKDKDIKPSKKKSHPLTREGFFKMLHKVTKPLPKPSSQDKPKQGND